MKLTFKNTSASAKCSGILLAPGIVLSSWGYQNCYFPLEMHEKTLQYTYYGALRMSLFIMWGIA